MLNLSEGICSELIFFLLIFESQYGDTGLEITEVIEQLLKLYENLTESYKARLHWLEEESKANSFRCEQEYQDHKKGHGFRFQSHRLKG